MAFILKQFFIKNIRNFRILVNWYNVFYVQVLIRRIQQLENWFTPNIGKTLIIQDRGVGVFFFISIYVSKKQKLIEVLSVIVSHKLEFFNFYHPCGQRIPANLVGKSRQRSIIFWELKKSYKKINFFHGIEIVNILNTEIKFKTKEKIKNTFFVD